MIVQMRHGVFVEKACKIAMQTFVTANQICLRSIGQVEDLAA
jgi:hypothetical protein